MKLWYYSLVLSVVSCVLLLVIYFLPNDFTIFIWSKHQVDAGVLFPVLIISWLTAILGFAANNIFIDKNMFEKKPVKMPSGKLYLPTILGIPGFSSFVWFVIRWYKGKPGT